MTDQSEIDLPDILFDRVPKSRKFEDRLWDAADNLRASARLKSSEYAAPLLGLFFLRYASNRFNAVTERATAEFEATKISVAARHLKTLTVDYAGFGFPRLPVMKRFLI